MRGRRHRSVGALLLAAAVAAVAAGATYSAAPSLVLYSFSGRLLTTPAPGANSLSARVEAGNARALRKLAGASPYQSFTVNAQTVFYRVSKGRRRVVSVDKLRAGDWITIRIRAAASARLQRIRATPARVVVDYGQRGRYADRTPPAITASASGIAGSNGWWTSDVTVSWRVDDPESGIAARAGCATTVVATETAGRVLTCSARNRIGLANSRSVTVRLDKTPPSVAAAPSRPPDRNGWYNHPVSVAFTGTDATSGVASCTSAGYGGPDNAAAVVSGSCTDRAGLTGSASLTIRYDATPPGRVRSLTARGRNRAVVLRWRRPADPDFEGVVITRTTRRRGAGQAAARVVYDGGGHSFRDRRLTNGTRYRYIVASIDRAGNRSPGLAATARPRLVLLVAPERGARVSKPPRLRWLRRPGATYYNVQIFRRGRKILSVWPTRPRFDLRRQWRYRGRRYRLRPGSYSWFVWPGRGARGRSEYGKLLGRSSFVVVAKKRR